MKRTRFTETQIVKAIQEHERRPDAKELCGELGIKRHPKWQKHNKKIRVFL